MPNCRRQRNATLFAATKQALTALGPTALQLRSDSARASAVYRVALVFKDDVNVAVDTTASGSRLHVRSASRVGHSDLGVNARRVDRLLNPNVQEPHLTPFLADESGLESLGFGLSREINDAIDRMFRREFNPVHIPTGAFHSESPSDTDGSDRDSGPLGERLSNEVRLTITEEGV